MEHLPFGPAPDGFNDRQRTLWADVTTNMADARGDQLEPHEIATVHQWVNVVYERELLEELVRVEGETVPTERGSTKANPNAVALNQKRRLEQSLHRRLFPARKYKRPSRAGGAATRPKLNPASAEVDVDGWKSPQFLAEYEAKFNPRFAGVDDDGTRRNIHQRDPEMFAYRMKHAPAAAEDDPDDYEEQRRRTPA